MTIGFCVKHWIVYFVSSTVGENVLALEMNVGKSGPDFSGVKQKNKQPTPKTHTHKVWPYYL